MGRVLYPGLVGKKNKQKKLFFQYHPEPWKNIKASKGRDMLGEALWHIHESLQPLGSVVLQGYSN